MPFRKQKTTYLDELINTEYECLVIYVPHKDIVVDGADAFLNAQDQAREYFEENVLVAYFEKTRSRGCKIAFVRESVVEREPHIIALEKD